GAPLHRTTSRWAPSPANAASGWRPSLPVRIASVASSCVLSLSLVGERLLHFQLNRNKGSDASAPARLPSPVDWGRTCKHKLSNSPCRVVAGNFVLLEVYFGRMAIAARYGLTPTSLARQSALGNLP